MTKRQSNP